MYICTVTIKQNNMTLQQYIDHLAYLRDKYQAGEYEVKTRMFELRETYMELADGDWDPITVLEDEYLVPMDGDDFHLDLEQKILQVDCKRAVEERMH